MGPVHSKFLGPVLIEVPHVSALRQGTRETAILRCDSAAKGKWSLHEQDDDIEQKLKVRKTINLFVLLLPFKCSTHY